jgi:hypothetical protein
MLRVAHALLATAALAPLCGVVGCGGKSPASHVPQAAATTEVPDAGRSVAGASGMTGGATGAISAGATSAAGTGAESAAGTGVPVAGAPLGADDGLLDAGSPACRVPDDIKLIDEDADGGVPAACHDVPRTIITENCIGYCHHNRGAPSGGLNLQSPCVADRLIDVISQCEGLLFVDSKDPERSFLLDKLEHEKPRCGKSMPDGYHLPPDQVACMNAWVHAIARAARKP